MTEAPQPSPRPGERRVLAAVDVGSNSVHILVASVVGGRLGPTLLDHSTFLHLGAAADAGCFGESARALALGTLIGYGELARDAGAERVTFVGTEPLRRSADAASLVRAVERAGWPLHVVSHEEEGLLTLIGATGGWPASTEIVVVDVGGGSTELALAGPGRRAAALGIRAGSNRLARALVAHDPPTAEEVAAMRDRARELLGGPADGATAALIAVGGTASNLVKVLAVAETAEPEAWLTRDRLEAAIAALVAAPADETAGRFGLSPYRARMLPAGAVILEAILDRYRVEGMRATDLGVREGAVLATARAGAHWRDALPRLADGWES